ncbi:MAG: MFS transporter [Actinomycetes bacterium]
MAHRVFVDLAPLRESRDFRLLFTGQLISMLGSQLTTVAIPFQVFSITHSSLQVGLVSLAQLIPLLVGSLVGGTVGDGMDRRRLLIGSGACSAAVASLLALNSMLARPSLLVIYVVSALAAGLVGFANPAKSAAIPLLVKPKHLVAAYSINQIVIQIATIVGPAISGVALGGAGLTWIYLIDALSFVVMALTAIGLSPLRPQSGAGKPGLRSILNGLGYLRGRHVLQGIYLIDLNAMVFGMPRALFPALAATTFGGSTIALGLLYAAPGVGALLGASTTGWVASIQRRGRAVVLAVVLWGIAIALFGWTSSLWLALVLLGIAGWADVISAVLRNTILQSSIPDHLRSRLSSFQMAVVQGGPRLGDLESGAVATISTTEISIISGGLACVIGAACIARALPGFWRASTENESETGRSDLDRRSP